MSQLFGAFNLHYPIPMNIIIKIAFFEKQQFIFLDNKNFQNIVITVLVLHLKKSSKSLI